MNNYSLETLISAHAYCTENFSTLSQPQICGCFHCQKLFPSTDLTEEDFIEEDSGKKTAFCPHCGIDAVIGSNDHELNPEFLSAMHHYWFNYR
ncbi:hypothetical protein [Neisseria weaveri]|uniref:Cytoplasmic protein n=1 Tax=Neisseria weaveri TaxID=28091 RepID=A0A448VJ40_9NEIS|nr:hypothetical protein [Neisseria weaveri]VEJ49764.1 Uncharacterised protein [Neisseria weaveri]